MCDTWVALANATRDGHVIFGKNSDRPIFDSQPLVYYPRRRWPAGSLLRLEHIEIPQAAETYATVGASPYWCWGYEEGINEHSVVIGNEAIFTKPFARSAAAFSRDPALRLGLLGMDLIRLGLERARSAAEAVEVMAALVENYGQFVSGVPTKSHAEGGYDGSFIIADPKEAWVLETAGTRWVARRFDAGATSISNQPSVRGQWDRGSADLVDYAIEMGWWPAECEDSFDFARAYIDDSRPRHRSHIRAMRSRQLLAEGGAITPAWMKRIARDHYEDTFLGGPFFDAADPDFLTICMHNSPAGFTWGNTASSCIAVLPRTQDELPIFWWTPGPPCNGCYVPFFVHGSALPPIVSAAGSFGKQVAAPQTVPQDTYSPDSYWWLFRELLDCTKGAVTGSRPGYYPKRNALVRARFDALECEFEAALPAVLQRAARLRHTAPEAMARELDRFSAACVEQVVAALHELLDAFEKPAP
ncbi:MAG TPA: C69 family dipeptidase [Caldilineaceae bacterium]|nr:C69 family dipeptidase [Caldilineaceae bacterium]